MSTRRPSQRVPSRQTPTRLSSKTASSGGTRPITSPERSSAVRARVPSVPEKNTALLIGAIVSGVAILGVLMAIVFIRSGTSTSEPGTPAGKSKPEIPVDVRELTEQGMRKCEEGYSLIQSCRTQMERSDLNAGERCSLKESLQTGVALIDTGMRHLEQAREKGGDGGDPRREWAQARKVANNFISNLGK